MAGKLISDLNSGTLSLADAMEIDKDVSGARTSFKTTVKDIVDFANHNVAEEYDSTSTYAIGDYVMYESTLYKCITAVSSVENFDSTKWTAVLVTDEMGSGGGGGTGGHTIIDENGNSMPARAGLQFVGGANVSDDATNNKTIVDLASAGGIDGVFIDTENVIQASAPITSSAEVTYTATEDCIIIALLRSKANGEARIKIDDVSVFAQYLPDRATLYYTFSVKKGQVVKMSQSDDVSSGSYTVYGIQTGTTHSKFQPVIYSTEEREIGVWTDGKPLYEKTFVLSSTVSLVSNGWTEITEISNTEIEQIVSVTGYGDSTSNGYLLDGLFADTAGTTGIRLLNPRSTNTSVRTVTLRYTKSSDTAGSGTWTPQGVPTHHYSTDEHIVGTWIDGKTLYEKTIDFGALPNATTKVVNHDISNIDYIVSAIGSATTSAKGMFPIPFVNDQTVGGQIMLMVNTSSVTIRTSTDRSEYINCYITLQYTKTS